MISSDHFFVKNLDDVDFAYSSNYLFNKIDFQKFHHAKKRLVFGYQPLDKIEAICCVGIEGKEAYSNYHLPFGGIDEGKELSEEEIDFFLEFVYAELKKIGVTSLILTLFPEAYQPSLYQFQKKKLLAMGGQVKLKEENYHIEVKDTSLTSKFSKGRLHGYRKCEKLGVKASRLTHSFLSEAYRIIETCHAASNYPVTMSLEQLKKSFNQFPDHYHLYGVHHENKLIAVSVVVEVHEKIVYTAYNGDDYEYRPYSPLVFLHNYLYDEAKNKGVEIIDLGLATAKGTVNEGLKAFKKSIGGIKSPKEVISISF